VCCKSRVNHDDRKQWSRVNTSESGSVRDFSLGRVTGAPRYTLEITRITRRLNYFPATPRECLNVSPASCPLIIVSLPEVVIALPIPSYTLRAPNCISSKSARCHASRRRDIISTWELQIFFPFKYLSRSLHTRSTFYVNPSLEY